MSISYSELHCHSNYSFQEGASSIGELLVRAKALEYPALALTDHDNLCGAMEFARAAKSVGVQPVIGAEVTLVDGSHLTLLVETAVGYGNLCQLVTHSRIGGDRRDPKLDPGRLPEHAEGLILLTGCGKGQVPGLAAEGRQQEGEARLKRLSGVVRGRQRLHRVAAEPGLRRHPAEQAPAPIGPRAGRGCGCHQQRPLPCSGTAPAAGRPGGYSSQQDTGGDPPGAPAQHQLLSQAGVRDGGAVQRYPGGPVQLDPHCRALRLRPDPQSRLRVPVLSGARRLQPPELFRKAVPRGGGTPVRRHNTPGPGTSGRGVPANSKAQPCRLLPGLLRDHPTGP